MDYLVLAISVAYTTLVSFWLMNHVKAIYTQQLDITDGILRKLQPTLVEEPEIKDYLYGVEYSLTEEE
tara:strand:+ start:360 stop:563 length:204 start_codon:yes stop_codon:yes gene_type:complete